MPAELFAGESTSPPKRPLRSSNIRCIVDLTTPQPHSSSGVTTMDQLAPTLGRRPAISEIGTAG